MKRKSKEKTTLGSDNKRWMCILCGEASFAKAQRWSPTNHNQLAVLLASHVVFGAVDVKHAVFTFKACASIRKRLCSTHFVDAARYLAMELMTGDIPFSRCENGLLVFGTPANANQSNESDLPRHLLEYLNEVVEQFEKDRFVTDKDVITFVNESLRRCHSGVGGDSLSEMLVGIRRNNPEKEETQPEETQNANYSNNIKQEEESENVDYGIPLSELTEPSCSSTSSSQVDSNRDDVTVAPVDLIRPLPRLEKTDPQLLQYAFSVDGEALIKLFKFCPQCGRKLEVDGAVRLIMDGAAPVVQYICDRCSQEGSIIKCWKAQEDRTWS